MGIAILVPGADFTGRAFSTVTPSNALAIEAISIIGPTYVRNEAHFSAKLFPIFTTQRNVTWSITTGGSYASISSDGTVTVNTSTTAEQSVIIKCTSSSEPSIYALKEITVIAQNIVEVGYLQSDGTGYFVLKATGDTTSCTITLRGYASTSNGYLFGQRISENSGWSKIGAYKQNNTGKIAVCLGNTGYVATDTLADANVKKFIYETSSSSAVGDGSFRLEDDSGTELFTRTNITMTAAGACAIFGYATGAVGATPQVANLSAGRFYGLSYKQNNAFIIDYAPCTVNGVPAILDRVSGEIFYASGTASGITYGY